jgi:hypothetical protein
MMKKRIPVVLDTDRKDYELAVENMISEGGPIHLLIMEDDVKDKEKAGKEEKPLH